MLRGTESPSRMRNVWRPTSVLGPVESLAQAGGARPTKAARALRARMFRIVIAVRLQSSAAGCAVVGATEVTGRRGAAHELVAEDGRLQGIVDQPEDGHGRYRRKAQIALLATSGATRKKIVTPFALNSARYSPSAGGSPKGYLLPASRQ